ncbi:MAG: PilZ domain-containing protein [Candidatus Omnitrophota bacterium]
MKEKRKFTRMGAQERKFLQKQGNTTQEIKLLDVSPGGMRILLDNNNLKVGSSIYGQFQILPSWGNFYVCGEVVWVKPSDENKKEDNFIVGVKFNKVSTVPL